jgi:hypothetical protein
LADLLLLPLESGKCKIAVFLFYLGHLPLPLETGKSYTFKQYETRNANWDSVEQIQISQESEKQKLVDW